MEIVERKINSIKPYGSNPRINDGAVDAVANSIQEFGFKVPIVIDKNGTIVAGHTRHKAAKTLHMKTVPCIVADDLTEEQIRAFRLADNKVSELADWDFDLLDVELAELPEFDMEQFGFARYDDDDDQDDGEYYGDERERTFNSMNLHDVDINRTAGRWQIPIIKATNHVPSDLISFNYVLNKDAFDKGVHFYIDDYQFERLWNNPHDYIDRLSMFDCVLTPDFSMYLEMPMAMQLWNVYRSRMIGQIMQDYGITVIPTLMWSTPESFDFCFDGIEPGGVVSVSTIGVKLAKDSRDYFTMGMDEAMKRLKPSHVVVYGGDIGYKYPCDTTYISNHNAERFANL